MPDSRGRNGVLAAQAAICAGFGAFILARAVRLSLTYDEAAACIRYISPHRFPGFDGGPLAVFNFEVATNHLLSTVLSKIATLVAGDGELALRVPALLGYALYLWFSARLLRQHAGRAVAIAGLLLLNLNPYLLDFFALGRGYGLSVGLMMGALYYFFDNRMPRMLVLATAAVLANFSMLNVYVALLILLLSSEAGLKADAADASRTYIRRGFYSRWGILPLGAAFAALVFSQDPQLSPSLYEPVSVTLQGLSVEQHQAARVSRVDLRGRVTPWTTARAPYRAIRVEVSRDISDRVIRIEAVIGNHAFTDDPRQPRMWTLRDLGTVRQFESGPSLSLARSSTREFNGLINWAGDRRYALAISRAAALTALLLGALALVLDGVGRLALRARLVPYGAWRAVSSSVLWIAALAGPPLYLLRRDAQLYFGGTRGLVQDTFSSLIDSSFYGVTYVTNQTQVVFLVAMVVVVAFTAFALIAYRRDPTRAPNHAARTLALIAIVSVSLVAQHWLLGTVYLIGRTAVLFIPLYLLFVIFFCQALIGTRTVARYVGASMLFALVLLSGWHFARTANLQYTLDWRDDAATKTMISDLERVVASEHRTSTVLGIEWVYAPAATYYSSRRRPGDIEVVVLPAGRRVDFLYVADRTAPESARVIRRYPVSGTALVR